MKKIKTIILAVVALALVMPSTAYAAKLPWPTLTKNKYKGGFSLYKGHNGMDIKASSGSVLYSPVDGTAKYYQRYRVIKGKKVLVSYGNYVVVTSKDKKTRINICHMSKFTNVKFKVSNAINAVDYWKKHDSTLSQASWKSSDKEVLCGTVKVSVGDILGYSGGTGRSTGPHLHVTLYVNGKFNKPVDPYKYFDPKVSARDKSAKNAKKAYQKILVSGTSFKCKDKKQTFTPTLFFLYDVDKDGVPELAAADGKHSHSVTSLKNHYHVLLWKYSGGKAVLVGGYVTKKSNLDTIRFDKKNKTVGFKTYFSQWEGLTLSGKYLEKFSGSARASMIKNSAANRKKYVS